MRLIIVSGLSGSGKSVALHMLEDLDFYCVDNIPAALLKPLISHNLRGPESTYARTAVGIDARNRPTEIATIPAMVLELRRSGIACEVLYLHASEDVLLKRYGETRRKHPLSSSGVGLLEPITLAADLVIDTSQMGVHALRELVRERIERRREGRLSLMFESFGFKHGIPGDADFVFDVRSLPNPYWEHTLRDLTGRDPAVIEYLESHAIVRKMVQDLAVFLDQRLPEFAMVNRNYLTIAIGCTGGQHRSVFIVERLAEHFRDRYPEVMTRHHSLDRT
jgi:UPF0042 nucleotide-binding protein